MSFDSIGGANAIKDILAGLSGIGGAQIGVPESIGPRVWGYVTVGSMIILPGTPGSTDRDTHYMATLAYRLDDNEGTAEATLMGLVDEFLDKLKSGTPTFAAGDIMSSHAGWVEVTDYSEATREVLTLGAVSGQSVNNSASKASFTINATVTVGGAFITTVSTKGGTTGILYGGGAFSQDRNLILNDILNVTVTLTAAAS